MSHQNPNFPSRPGTLPGREIGTGSTWNQPQQQTSGMMPGVSNAMPNNGMPGTQGGRQMSPLDQIQAMMRSGQLNNSVSYEERKSPTNMDYSSIDNFINGGSADGQSQSDIMALRREEAKNTVAPLIMHIVNELVMRNARFKSLEIVTKNFSVKFTDGYPVKVVKKYWEMICNNSTIRQTIGMNAGTLFAHQMATGIMADAPPDARQSELLFQGCLDNTLAMELCRWLSVSPSGRQLLLEDGPAGTRFRQRLMDQYRERAPSISESFAFMGIPSPYDGFEPKLEEQLDHASNPANYAVENPGLYGVAPEPYHTPHASVNLSVNPESTTPVTDMLFELNRRMEENKKREQEEQIRSGQVEQTYYREELTPHEGNDWGFDDDQPIVFGEPTGGYSDYERMNRDNHTQYNWKERLIAIPHTNLFTADEEMLEVMRNAFFRCDYRYMRSIPGFVTVFTLDHEGIPNPDDRLISTRGRKVETFLTNPELLLPELKETEDGIVEVREVELTVDEEEQYDLDAVREAALEDTQIRNTFIDEVAVNDLEQHDREAFHVHTMGRREGTMHATSNVEVHYETTLMNSPTSVGEVYRCLPMLIKDHTVNTSYFDFIKQVYSTLGRQFLQEGELVRLVDTYLKTELERHMIERYGFDNTPNSDFCFEVHTLTDCSDELADYIAKVCPEAYDELSKSVTSQTLIAKSQCFLDRTEALRLLTANIRPKSRTRAVEEYDAAMRVVFVREVIITRISNMVPPVNSAGDTISIVKRSELPNLFKLVAAAYGTASSKLKPGAEQVIVFTDASDQRWTFQTNRYDRSNVGTLRKLKDGEHLALLELMKTY